MSGGEAEPADVSGLAAGMFAALTKANDAVVLVDVSGTVVWANDAALQQGGRTRDELIGSSMLTSVHPDDLERFVASVARALEPDLDLPSSPTMVRIVRGDGSVIRVELGGGVGEIGADGNQYVAAIGRPTTDVDLYEDLLDLLASDVPSHEAFAMVPKFGSWRQLDLLYGVFWLDDSGLPMAAGDKRLLGLGGLEDSSTPWSAAARDGSEILSAIADLDPSFAARARAAGLVSVHAVPVADPLHEGFGVVVLAQTEETVDPASAHPLQLAGYISAMMSRVLGLVLSWRRQVVKLHEAAATDPLTGLANRHGFWTFLDMGLLVQPQLPIVGVLYVDLDRFKEVNDTLGHAAGDAVLVEVAARLRALVRPVDLIARLGGDEFAVVLRGLVDEKAAEHIAERVVARLGEPYESVGSEVDLGASVGVATSSVDDFDAERLLVAADRALYRAKAEGRDCWRVETATSD